ncbi:MAG: hypothetical protein IPK50_04550 [Fibrobacterota bacterium]|nr:hypothetical protein [Fibrobacterota bacterium]QQS06166.1 MAG: hypothetical protein IPK50_04550 [Fibrobacterota bacterium]
MLRVLFTAFLVVSSFLFASETPTPKIVPSVGSVLTWKYERTYFSTFRSVGWNGKFASSSFRMSRDSGEVAWVVASELPDSVQWRRFEIRQTVLLSRTDTTDTSSTSVGIVYHTPRWSQIQVRGTVSVALRVERNSGSAFASQNSLFPMEQGWWSGGSPLVSSRTKYLFCRDGIDTVFFERSWDTAWSGTIVTRSTDSTVILRLIPERSQIQQGTGVRPHAPTDLPTLQELSERHPEIMIKWTLASGKTGTIPASALASLPSDLRNRSLILQARLPDGRPWQSTTILH